ncbi:MAG: AraC family transcriptional regulator [Oscillospiraceae bacterium]|nr:AraC family transcriptional regulator [Oscillospiraceae bacterium]
MRYEPMITKSESYRSYLWKGHDFGPHWHSEVEVLTCLEGSTLVRVENRQYPLTPGQVLIIPGNEAHQFISDGSKYRLMIQKFGYSLLGSDFTRIQSSCLYFRLLDGPEALTGMLQKLMNCLLADGSITQDNEWKMRAYVTLLAYGLRSVPSTYRPSENQINRTRRLAGIYPALDYVEEHFREHITLDDAAKLTGYAKTYFCKHFKRVTGISFHQYLNRYRISVACLLLEDPGLSVATIAEMTGFSSAKLFCRIFKETTNMTTSQYQRLSPEEKKRNWMS